MNKKPLRVLVLASDNPFPPINGTRIRNHYLWQCLREQGIEVKILAITRNPEDLNKSNDQIEFFMFTRKSFFKRMLMPLFYSYHQWPVSEKLIQRVKELNESWKPDIIHAEELRMGFYLPQKKKDKSTKLSICVHNVESELIKKTKAAPLPYGISFFNFIYRMNLQRFEKTIFERADLRMTYSEVDKKIYESLYPHLNWRSSSNGVNLIHLTPAELTLPEPHKILFLGSLSYLPNVEGLFWFLDDIYPVVKNNFQLTVAGSTPCKEVKERLERESIELIDTPLDLKPVYLKNSLLVVPLLSGSGTRGKILESFMYGRPVLTTTKGVEGLSLSEEEGAMIANHSDEMIFKLKEWIQLKAEERQKLAHNGRNKVLTQYTWNKVADDLLSLWSKPE